MIDNSEGSGAVAEQGDQGQSMGLHGDQGQSMGVESAGNEEPELRKVTIHCAAALKLGDDSESTNNRNPGDEPDPAMAFLEGDRLALLQEQMNEDLSMAKSIAEDEQSDPVRKSFLTKLTSGKPFRLNSIKTCFFKRLTLTREEHKQAAMEYDGVF